MRVWYFYHADLLDNDVCYRCPTPHTAVVVPMCLNRITRHTRCARLQTRIVRLKWQCPLCMPVCVHIQTETYTDTHKYRVRQMHADHYRSSQRHAERDIASDSARESERVRVQYSDTVRVCERSGPIESDIDRARPSAIERELARARASLLLLLNVYGTPHV